MNRISVKLAALLTAAMLCGCTAAPAETTEGASNPATTAPTVVTTAPTEVTTAPTEETYPEVTLPQVEGPEAGSIDYETYQALSEAEQQAYFDNFESADAFFTWLDEAEAAYDATMPTIVGEEGVVEDWE